MGSYLERQTASRSTRPGKGGTWALVLAVVLLGACSSEVRDSRPLGTIDDILSLHERDDLNVLFILVDTLRVDRLSAYGYERRTTPVLDELTATGLRFARHVSQSSWTKCSMASLWTGLYPNRTGVLRAQHALSEEAMLPAEIFQGAGFRTAGIWRNGWIAPNFGFGQGFEIYHSPRGAPLPASVRRENPSIVGGSDADLIRSAAEFLRAHQNDQWFLYLHMMDLHQYSYDEPSALFGTSYSDAYDNSIHWTDSLLGHLFADLERRNLRDKTLIVFSSDHGEAFGEHDGEGHARNVYGEVTETPFLVSFPFRLDPGIVVEVRSENVDLWPTILDLVGLPPLLEPDGRSLLPAIEAAARKEPVVVGEGTAFAQIDQTWGRLKEEPSPTVAVNDGKWRLIYFADRPARPELFDKESDPREQRNLAEREVEVAERLTEQVETYLEPTSPPWGEEAPLIEIDEMQLRQLRAIGYGVQ